MSASTDTGQYGAIGMLMTAFDKVEKALDNLEERVREIETEIAIERGRRLAYSALLGVTGAVIGAFLSAWIAHQLAR